MINRLLHNRIFLEGIGIGALMGLVTGTLLALQVDRQQFAKARRSLFRWVTREKPHPIPYEALRF